MVERGQVKTKKYGVLACLGLLKCILIRRMVRSLEVCGRFQVVLKDGQIGGVITCYSTAPLLCAIGNPCYLETKGGICRLLRSFGNRRLTEGGGIFG